MSPRQPTPSSTPPRNPVAEWRRDRLLSVGFPPGLAIDLADDCRIDLHALLDLTDRGCQPDLAARILAPLDDPRRAC